MLSTKGFIIAIGFILTGQIAFAKTSTDIQTIIQQAEQQNLAEHPIWRQLLYYPSKNNKQSSSRVEKGDFFVHAQGNQNPKTELNAMLQALLAPNQVDHHSVQCRFPARTYWLSQQLNLSLPNVDCPEFNQWISQLKPKSATLVFAEEYLKNPVSAFAHVFLQFDHQDDPQKKPNFKLYVPPKPATVHDQIHISRFYRD